MPIFVVPVKGDVQESNHKFTGFPFDKEKDILWHFIWSESSWCDTPDKELHEKIVANKVIIPEGQLLWFDANHYQREMTKAISTFTWWKKRNKIRHMNRGTVSCPFV